MEIKILGGGCPKCERLEAVTRDVVAELGIEANFYKVKALPEIMKYDIVSTPALVVDEQVLCNGRIPARDEVKTWLSRGI